MRMRCLRNMLYLNDIPSTNLHKTCTFGRARIHRRSAYVRHGARESEDVVTEDRTFGERVMALPPLYRDRVLVFLAQQELLDQSDTGARSGGGVREAGLGDRQGYQR